MIAVPEVHVDRTQVGRGARQLGIKVHADTFIGLNTQYQRVGRNVLALQQRIAEHHIRCMTILYDHLGIAARKALAGAQIKRDTGPAPAVDHQLDGDIGLGFGIRSDLRFVAIIRHTTAIREDACSVLATYRGGKHIVMLQRLDCPQHLGLLITNGIGIKGIGRFHGNYRQQGQHVIRDHVT